MDGLGLFKEFGLLGIVIGAVILLLFLVIKWTLSTTKEIIKQAADERKTWQMTIDRNTQFQEKIVQAIDKHDEKANERGRYAREEHHQIIEVLGRLNGYRKP